MICLTNSPFSWSECGTRYPYSVHVQVNGLTIVVVSIPGPMGSVEPRVYAFDSLYELDISQLKAEHDIHIPWALLNTWDPTSGTSWWLPLLEKNLPEGFINGKLPAPECKFPCQLHRALRSVLENLLSERKERIQNEILTARSAGQQPDFEGCRVGKKASCHDGRCPCSSVVSSAITSGRERNEPLRSTGNRR